MGILDRFKKVDELTTSTTTNAADIDWEREKIKSALHSDYLASIVPTGTPYLTPVDDKLKTINKDSVLSVLERIENLEEAVEKLIRWGPGV